MAVVIAVFFILSVQGNKDESDDVSPDQSHDEVREFDMIARNFEFVPGTIKVDQGDNVKLNIKSTDVTHGIAIPEYDINRNLPAGETVEIDFIADKKGTFSFYCSVYCGSGHGAMSGKLIVE